MGETVSFASNGDQVEGYLAASRHRDPGPVCSSSRSGGASHRN